MILALIATAAAESWCAVPLVAHEWGVTVLHPNGGKSQRASVPEHFHTTGRRASDGPAVRTLPPDSGERDLPVLHFYAPDGQDPIPVGIEVGFTLGEASAWFPAVTRRIPAATANADAAAVARSHLQSLRAQRGPEGDVGPDPTKQLHWDRLLLTRAPLAEPAATDTPWITDARGVEQARWVNGPGETDRFVFYEADTRERPALVVEHGGSGQPDHFVLRNTSDWDVHDVVFVHDGRSWTAPRIPAGKTAGFLLRDRFDVDDTRNWLDQRWTDTTGVPRTDGSQTCEMMRDPAVPAEDSTGHRMMAAELELLWGAWQARLLGGDATRLVYREDPAALDAVMPLAVYTDMFHVPSLARLGVVLVEGPTLP